MGDYYTTQLRALWPGRRAEDREEARVVPARARGREAAQLAHSWQMTASTQLSQLSLEEGVKEKEKKETVSAGAVKTEESGKKR